MSKLSSCLSFLEDDNLYAQVEALTNDSTSIGLTSQHSILADQDLLSQSMFDFPEAYDIHYHNSPDVTRHRSYSDVNTRTNPLNTRRVSPTPIDTPEQQAYRGPAHVDPFHTTLFCRSLFDDREASSPSSLVEATARPKQHSGKPAHSSRNYDYEWADADDSYGRHDKHSTHWHESTNRNDRCGKCNCHGSRNDAEAPRRRRGTTHYEDNRSDWSTHQQSYTGQQQQSRKTRSNSESWGNWNGFAGQSWVVDPYAEQSRQSSQRDASDSDFERKQSSTSTAASKDGGHKGASSSPTTIMLRNIPNKYTQRMLVQVLNDSGFEGSFDFFYLPIDFRNRCNVGYAFLNFVCHSVAAKFKKDFAGRRLSAFNSNKVCEVSWARVQGLESNVEHYRNSPVNGVPIPQYRPMIFVQGKEVPFPDPDAPLAPVRLRPPKI